MAQATSRSRTNASFTISTQSTSSLHHGLSMMTCLHGPQFWPLSSHRLHPLLCHLQCLWMPSPAPLRQSSGTPRYNTPTSPAAVTPRKGSPSSTANQTHLRLLSPRALTHHPWHDCWFPSLYPAVPQFDLAQGLCHGLNQESDMYLVWYIFQSCTISFQPLFSPKD